MLLYLDCVAITCFILFIFLLIIKMRKIRKTGNYKNAGCFTIFFSWILIIVFLVCIGGITYGSIRPAQFNQVTSDINNHFHHHHKSTSTHHHKKVASSSSSKSSSSSSNSQTNTPDVVWSPDNPAITNGKAVRVRFLIPANTSVTVQGHRYHRLFGSVPAAKDKQDVTIKFTDSGTYDIIVKYKGQTYTKQMIIN